jgi:hypothetical protein
MKKGSEKRLNMRERRVLVKAFAADYRKACKKEKGELLHRFVHATGYGRRYAARLLRGHGRTVPIAPGVRVRADATMRVRRSRARVYDEAVAVVLRRVWRILDYLCGKRLVAALPGAVEALQRHGELHLSDRLREKLLRMSAATADRLLAPEKKKQQLKGRGGTKPGTLLRQQIAVHTFAVKRLFVCKLLTDSYRHATIG